MGNVQNAKTRSFAKLFLISVAAVLANPQLTQALPLVIDVEADTTVRTDLSVRRNDNYGLTNVMQVGTSRGGGGIPFGGPDAMRSLIRFDLTGNTAQADRAIVELTISTFSPDTVFEIGAYQLLEPWVEGNGCEGPFSTLDGCPAGAVGTDPSFGVAWQGGPDSFNSQGATLGLNNQTQPAFDPTVIATSLVDTSLAEFGDVVQLDITSLYNAWIAGVPNEGLLLRDITTDGDFRQINFGTRDDFLFVTGNASPNAPGARLVVTLIPEPGTMALIIAGFIVALGWKTIRIRFPLPPFA